MRYTKDIYFIKGDFSSYYKEENILRAGSSCTVRKCIKNEIDKAFAEKVVTYRGSVEKISSTTIL
jgi:hypothetical protein